MTENKSSQQVLTSNSEVLNISKTSVKLKVRAAIHKHTYDYRIEGTDEYIIIRNFERSTIHNIYMTLKRQDVVSQYKKGKHSGAWFLRVTL